MEQSIQEASAAPQQSLPLGEAFRRMSQSQGAVFGSGVSYICSVFPVPKRDEQNHFWVDLKGRTSHKRIYQLKAVTDPNKYDVLELFDTGVQTLNTGVTDRHEWMLRPITARDVATSLAEKWTRSGGLVDSAGGSGIGIIAENRPSDSELLNLHKKQRILAKDMMDQADECWASDQKKQVTRLHRLLANYLGINNADRSHPWLLDYGDSAGTKRCIACNTTIDAGAKVCLYCRFDLVIWAADRFYTPEELQKDDPVLAAELKKHYARVARSNQLKPAAAVPPSLSTPLENPPPSP